MSIFDNKGWMTASTHEERVFEAAQFFGKGRRGGAIAQAEVQEAFTTHDFPILLADAFTQKAIAAQKAAVDEFEPILAKASAPDFTRHKLVDLWGGDAFEKVGEGEEYRGGKLKETGLDHGTAKWGKSYPLTFELRLRRIFSDLANFPQYLGSGATKAKNNAVAELLTDSAGWSDAYFGTVETVAFSPEALDAAIKALALRTDHRGDSVDVSQLVLVHGPGLRGEVSRVLNAYELEMQVTNGTKVTKTKVTNPFKGVVTALESRTVGTKLGAYAGSGWALVQAGDSALPSLINTGLEGHDGNVDIRVKRDQGESLGGGLVPVDQGSFNDDTIWYRGRTFFGIDAGFTTGVYASNGAA